MKQVKLTIKLKFVNLNRVKAEMFAQMEQENICLANKLLSLPYMERRKITTAKISSTLASALSNQTIRHTISATGREVKNYTKLPIEINKQNWSLHKVGDTYSLSFPTIKGVKRVPVEVASPHWQTVLEKVLANQCDKGCIRLLYKRNAWYAYMSVTLEVPEVQSQNRIGVDRGQNNLAVAASSRGFAIFFSGLCAKHRRRYYQQRRKSLLQAKKFRALKKQETKEHRWLEAVNHTISRRIVRFTQFLDADVVLEDLKGCLKTTNLSGKTMTDLGDWDSHCFCSLEQKLIYKIEMVGRKVIKVPAAYTSKTCSTCGTLGDRKKHDFNCPNGHYHHADHNAAVNLARWVGFTCDLNLKEPLSAMESVDSGYAVLGTPQSRGTVYCTPTLRESEMSSGHLVNTYPLRDIG
ncbi:RNA-guided endonuclease TnpB family protein [Mastigocladopsis repens]|uniref:RNA-guided endonuclease TnpB family protein n=1 Tax=Mastigocladopsis repens TaxID=221287 RepID=UPI000316427E|nr:RNA-guided endonuclease TnpB family protein [Mastigocladopsis repens]